MAINELQGCLGDVCETGDQQNGSSSYAGFYFNFCTLISHVLLTGITVAIVYKCLVLKLAHTAGHAFYCTIAFVFFMGEALLVRNSRSLEAWIGQTNLNRLHAILGLLAFLVGVGGIAIKTWQKLERKREDPNATVRHFRSNHGFFGIVGCALLLGSVLSGLPLYFISSSVTLKFLHRFFGLIGFLALMVSQMFGYNTGFGRRQWKRHHQNLFKFFTFIATITTSNYELRRFVRDIFVLISNSLFQAEPVQAREDL
ncbi:uncharacterized protein [Drosophila pseudoobscura]|uniref:ascorbate ferrireductase (transmembrane) n=1 Tax=Drosophila pseudoobscura pseudoobscura TaxID=46245 RepID=A0A6I8ULD7_DROPS|nr:uncharacterized protein LOC4818180 [Drosophila pseudoobscura]